MTQVLDPPAGVPVTQTSSAPPDTQPPPLKHRSSPLRPRNFGSGDVGLLLITALSSFAFVWVVFYQLTLLSGVFGFLVCWYFSFLALYWMVVNKLTERQLATDRVVTVIMTTGAAIAIGLVIFIIIYVFAKAVAHIHWIPLFTKTQKGFEPAAKNALAHVGIAHAIVGTLEEVGVAALIGVPIAVATAVFLNEVGGWGTRFVRTIVTAMSGLPSIVAGLFIFTIFIQAHWLGYSGFAASLALFVMLLPSVTRTTEEVLRVVPSGLREASQALGAPEWRTTWSVVLPTAKSGVVTAVLLGVARIVGETAPLLFTAFGSQILNGNVFSHPQESLPLEVWSNVRQAQPVLISLAYQAGFVLMALVLVLFVAARIAGRTKKSKSQRSWVSRITGGSSPGSSSGRTTGGSSGGSTGGTPNSSPSGSPNSSLHPANADLVALLGGDGPTES